MQPFQTIAGLATVLQSRRFSVLREPRSARACCDRRWRAASQSSAGLGGPQLESACNTETHGPCCARSAPRWLRRMAPGTAQRCLKLFIFPAGPADPTARNVQHCNGTGAQLEHAPKTQHDWAIAWPCLRPIMTTGRLNAVGRHQKRRREKRVVPQTDSD